MGTTTSVTGADTNNGTRSAPFASLARACQEMTESKNYTVYINGTVSGKQVIPGSLISATAFQATRITLTAKSGDTGTINAGLSAASSATEKGSALTIDATIPVTIESIKGGYTESSGGGINCAGGGTVTLNTNVSIRENYSTLNGGGISISSGTLDMKGGTIAENSSAVPGGAVAVTGTAIFKMSGNAYIPSGVTVSGTNVTGEGKNDVYLETGRVITITDTLTTTASPIAAITPQNWGRGAKILSANAGTLISSETSASTS